MAPVLSEDASVPAADDPSPAPAPAMSVSFRPHAGLLTETREFVSSFCGTFVRDPHIILRIVMALHELLENAIKYSLDGSSEFRIELRSDDDGDPRISIRTHNRASSDAIAAMSDAVRRIHEAPDPFEFYCDLVRESAERGDLSGLGRSGLGLARICGEAGLTVETQVNGDCVSILAVARVDPRSLR
jgi:hypothetical protein